MPIYEYFCKKCNYIKEITHSIKKSPVVKCNKCNKRIERIISNTSFKLIGNDWPGQEIKNLKRNR